MNVPVLRDLEAMTGLPGHRHRVWPSLWHGVVILAFTYGLILMGLKLLGPLAS